MSKKREVDTMIGKPRVLVVDDEPGVIKSCDRILTQEEIEVEGVTSGLEGLELVKSRRYDAVLLDLKMPDLNGMEVLRRLKRTSPETTVIIITGYPSVDTAVEALKLGAFDYVPKPFTPDEITEKVRRALKLQELLRKVEPAPAPGVMENLLKTLEECGEVAFFYKGQKILAANKLFADLFGRDIEECKGLPIIEICHEESIDMIRDFIRRRKHGDHDVPITYEASFMTSKDPKKILMVTVIKTKNTEGALLGILQKKE